MAPSRPVTRLIQRGRCLGRRAAAFFSLSRRRAGPAPTVARGGHCAERAQERRSQGAQRDRANRRLRGFRAPPPRRPAASAAQAGAGGDCGLPQGREHPLCNTEILQRRIAHQHAPPSPPLPPEAALAPQRAMCGILDGYVGQHSVKTRYGNAMPCLFRYLQVDGMPPHPNLPPGSKPAGDGRPAGRRHAAALERRREGRAQRGKAVHGRARASQGRPRHVCRIEKDDDTTSALNRAMAAGRAVTYAPADPGWSILGGPPNKPAPRMPPGGAGGGSGGRRRPAAGERGGAGTSASLPPAGPERRDDGRLRPAAAGRGLRAPALHHLPRDAALIARIGSRRRLGWPSAPGTQDIVPRRSPRAPPEGY